MESDRREAAVRAQKRKTVKNILGVFYEIRLAGTAYTTGKTVKMLRDKGWTIEPPKDEDVYQ